MKAKHLISYEQYVLVWLALLVLTGATIAAAGLSFGKWGALASVIIAMIKGGLVLFIFMNLRYESAAFKIMVMVAIITLAIIMILTFADTIYR